MLYNLIFFLTRKKFSWILQYFGKRKEIKIMSNQLKASCYSSFLWLEILINIQYFYILFAIVSNMIHFRDLTFDDADIATIF